MTSPPKADLSGTLNYTGFVEGERAVGRGIVDVVATEGFANIALKTAEGTARQIGQYLRAGIARTCRRLGYLLAKSAF